MSYADLSHARQIASVRRTVIPLLRRYGLGDCPLRLALHRFNTTYRIATQWGEVAIRVNVNSTRTFEEVRGELAWTQALHEEGRVLAPGPIPLFDGSPFATMRMPEIDRELAVVAYRWLPGRHVGKNRPLGSAFLLGELMANLHEMTAHWELPPGTSRPPLQTVLEGLPWRLPEVGPFREVYERSMLVLERLKSEPRQLVHFDLHFGNVKVWRGRMSVFDFDDCVLAWPGVDAAQAMFYLRRGGIGDPLETAFWEGARTTVEGLGLTREEFELLIGGRALLLATDLVGTMSAQLSALGPRYVRVMDKRLTHLLKTGEYNPSVASLREPVS